MRNREVADILTRMGTLLEVKGELVFKIRAYFKAAENILNLCEDIETLRKEDRLSEIPGVGKTLQEKIIDFLDTGKMMAYEQLIQEIPESILEVIHVPSIGPKKAKLFYEKLDIKSLDDLKRAAESGELLTLPGIREKTIENVLRGVRVVQQGVERMGLGEASRLADEVIEALKKVEGVRHICPAGSLRRGCETIGDIDILVESTHPKEVMEAFVHLPMAQSVIDFGETKSSIRTEGNRQIDLRVMASKDFGAALLYFTGSKSFNIKLRQRAIKKKMKISEYGVFKVSGKKETLIASQTEQECLKALGLEYIPPEIREEIGEARIFQGEPIPELVDLKDIKGDLHVHSTYSDGKNTITEMVQAAMGRGYQYLAICDHSYRLRVANGVSVEDLKKKRKEIDRLNAQLKDFRILFGSEVEIDMEGELDYNDHILGEFDIVVAAIHSGFDQNSSQLTKRLVKACQNKHVNIIAHPMGTHSGKREPYTVDFKEVCQAAVDHNVFLEINAFPVRLDLNTVNAYFAKNHGVKFSINTDAHHINHLKYMKLGVTIARRSWLTKDDALNAWPVDKLFKEIKK